MTPQAIAALVHSRFPDAQEIPLPPSHVRGDESYLLAPAASILPLGDFLRRDESLSFDNLSFLTAIDWKTYFEVVYYLVSTLRRHKLVLKVKLENRAAAEIASVTSIWPAADWQERELFDLMGIRFSGHYNLRRILLPDDWEGHPLLKDYVHKTDRYD